jgi:hypothetical protein
MNILPILGSMEQGGAASPLLAFDITFIVFIIIIAASALFNWLKRRSEMQDEWENPPRPGHPPRHEPPRTHRESHEQRPMSWEEELRRLLEGERTEVPPPPPQRQPAPPPVYTPPQPTRPATPPVRPPVIVREAGPPPPRRYEHAKPPVKAPKVVARTVSEKPGAPVRHAALPAPNLAYETRSRPPAAGQGGPRRPQEVEQALKLFRHPSTARQAVIATVILNPAKAFES